MIDSLQLFSVLEVVIISAEIVQLDMPFVCRVLVVVASHLEKLLPSVEEKMGGAMSGREEKLGELAFCG